MCGRFVLYMDIEDIFDRYDIEHERNFVFKPSYNVAPSEQIVAIIHDGQNNRAGLLRWGLIPVWAKEASIGMKMINARAETLNEKPAFKQLLVRKRCIIPANGFYEWKKVGSKKQPMYIGLRDEDFFSFAGLYDTWIDPSGNKVSTCTIITTQANAFIEDIHERMPVILDREQEKLWLDRSNENSTQLLSVLQQYPAERMTAYPVFTAVGSVKNNSPELIIEANPE